ncbi:MAG: type II toxin-antitoxin system HicB family antitoxin [Colwellia sp.]
MKYPVLIKKHAVDGVYIVSVPDLPGCQAKAETIDMALEQVTKTIKSHLSILAEYGEAIPNAKSIENHHNENNNVDIIWAIVDIDITPYLGKSHKINVTLPELLISQIDDRVSKNANYKTRSGFIASACLAELAK